MACRASSQSDATTVAEASKDEEYVDAKPTQAISARCAVSIPRGASSTTMHDPGFLPISAAAAKNRSGSGFEGISSVDITTFPSNLSESPSLASTKSNIDLSIAVAMAIGNRGTAQSRNVTKPGMNRTSEPPWV